jgi:hypothetical protein
VLWGYLAVGACWPVSVYAVVIRAVAAGDLRILPGGIAALPVSVGVYAGLVLLTTQVFRVHTPVAVAAATLAAAGSCTRPWNPPTSRRGSANVTETGFRLLPPPTVKPGRARHHQPSIHFAWRSSGSAEAVGADFDLGGLLFGG